MPEVLSRASILKEPWIPAFAGMTRRLPSSKLGDGKGEKKSNGAHSRLMRICYDIVAHAHKAYINNFFDDSVAKKLFS